MRKLCYKVLLYNDNVCLQFLAMQSVTSRWEQLLASFHLDPSTFPGIMSKYAAVATGTCVRSVILAEGQVESTPVLDLLVAVSQAPDLSAWIQESTVYRAVSASTRASRLPDYCVPGRGTSKVKEFDLPDGTCTLRLVSTKTSFPAAVLPGFKDSSYMCAITPVGVIELYPELALRRIGLLNSSGHTFTGGAFAPSDAATVVQMQHTSSGVALAADWVALQSHIAARGPAVDIGEHTCEEDPSCPRTRRSFVDRGVHLTPFDGFDLTDLQAYLPDAVWMLAHNGRCGAGETAWQYGFVVDGSTARCW